MPKAEAEIGFLSQSPLTERRYRKWFRKAFLFAALRTKSSAIREELSLLACGLSVGELLDWIEQDLISGVPSFDPHAMPSPYRPKPGLLRYRRRAEVRSALLDLAWLLANQEANPDDARNAVKLYSWLNLRFGAQVFGKMHRVDMALLALRLADERLATLAGKLPTWTPADLLAFAPSKLRSIQVLGIIESLSAGFRRRRDWSIPMRLLRVDLSNPWRGKELLSSTNPAEEANESEEAQAWLDSLSSALLPKGVARLELESSEDAPVGSAQKPFDRLTAVSKPETELTPLVTVVMSCFQPGEHFILALRSVLASNHSNLEVLVIDDASAPKFDSILKRAALLDSRVRVLHQESNGGTYRIRNRALDEARGDFITFHDSDDWMHPERITRQLGRLLKSGHPANISMSIRCSENLEFAESSRRFRIGLCEPSLLMKRVEVVRKIGYFDSVRKSGDAEYRQRIQKAFGLQLEVIEPFRVLTLQRGDNGGLTAGDLGYRWITEFRLAYRDSFQRWQRTTKRLFIERSEERQFFAPRPVRFPSKLAHAKRELDLVVAANFCDSQNASVAMKLISSARQSGKTVGCWQIYSIYPLQLERGLRPELLALLDSGEVTTVYPEDQLEVNRLALLAPSAYLTSHRTRDFNWEVRQIDTDPAPESWQETGEASSEWLEKLMRADWRV